MNAKIQQKRLILFYLLIIIGMITPTSSQKKIACLSDGKCFICNPKLRDKGRLWCREHYRYEDRCWLCHPELEDKTRDWCNVHHLFQDECHLCQSSTKENKTALSFASITNAKRCTNDGKCFICNPKLRDKGRLWCREHGRYEDRCFLCHPELEDKSRNYCYVHYLFEDECHLCKPGEIVKKKPAKARSLLFCNEHGVPESECTICHPQILETVDVCKGFKFFLNSNDSYKKAGIKTQKAYFGHINKENMFFSKITYNKNRFITINPLYSGRISTVYVNQNQRVKKGQLLLEMESAAVSQLKSEYLSLLNEKKLRKDIFKREKILFKKKISSREDYESSLLDYDIANNKYISLKQRLINAGFSNQYIEILERGRNCSPTLGIYAPFSGTVTEQFVTLGTLVNEDTKLFQIVDLTNLWLEISIPSSYANSLSKVKPNDKIRVDLHDIIGTSFYGKLLWVSSSIDENSRMLKACAVLENKNRLLKNGMYGNAQIESMVSQRHIIVHKDALQKIDGNEFVFIQKTAKEFEIRKVLTGDINKNNLTILNGLNENEHVVTVGSFTLKSNLLKERFGAGCTCGSGI